MYKVKTFCHQVKQIFFRWLVNVYASQLVLLPRQSVLRVTEHMAIHEYKMLTLAAMLLCIFSIINGTSCECKQNMETDNFVGIVLSIFAEKKLIAYL
jgi:hypothetical protein